jgi:hypothetical protein
MRRIMITLVAVALLVAGCGTDEEAERARAEAQEELAKAQEDLEEAEEALEEGEDCVQELRGFMRKLGDLDAQLQVGLSYSEHSDAIQETAIAYNRIAFDNLELDCLHKVGLSAEKAYRKFAQADSVWNDCISDFGCDSDSIDPELQNHWQSGSKMLDEAQDGISEMTSEPEEEIEELAEKIEQHEAAAAED